MAMRPILNMVARWTDLIVSYWTRHVPATGVIFRHPDIKWLRKTMTSKNWLNYNSKFSSLLKWLKPGGTLLYATCSILPQENRDQISAFLEKRQMLKLNTLAQQNSPQDIGWQITPGQDNMDGIIMPVY